MGIPQDPKPAKLFIALLCSREELFDEVEKNLAHEFGPLELVSPVFPWEMTDFYRKEMGPKLLRKFVSHAPLVPPEDLAAIKLKTQELESRYMKVDGNRRGRQVNLDPGYLDANKVVLATTKDASHRIYLSRGIYGEVTLGYRYGSFHPQDYTYPDYRWEETLGFFNKVRAHYMEQLKLTRSC
ncbi:MAG: DUF4416 family protein [Deltaproteobacteria bacterium]|nr:DUF4416 family protein [Deltaproteobacteria bacterium]